jgi:hypothetical protein
LGGDVAPYIGNGIVKANGGTLTGETILGGGGNITTVINTASSVSGTLVYNFIPRQARIPELDPTAAGSVLALLAGGVLTLRGRRRS